MRVLPTKRINTTFQLLFVPWKPLYLSSVTSALKFRKVHAYHKYRNAKHMHFPVFLVNSNHVFNSTYWLTYNCVLSLNKTRKESILILKQDFRFIKLNHSSLLHNQHFIMAPLVRKPISANPRLNRPNPQNKFVLRLNSVPRSSR